MINQGVGYTFTNDRRGSSIVVDPYLPTRTDSFGVTEDSGKIRVRPGTVNNVMPTANGTKLDAATPPLVNLPTGGGNDYMVVIKCMGEKAKRFPTSATVEIVTYSEAQNDTNEYGYLAIASLTKNTVTIQGQEQVFWTITQLVSGSVWGERRKLTSPATAFYYFSRV